MATRFYFPASDTTSVTPTFGGASPWNDTSLAVRRKLNLVKGSSAITTGSTISYTSGLTALDRQYVSEALTTGTTFSTSDTFSLQLMVREFATTDNVDVGIAGVFIVSADGSIIRATLVNRGNNGPILEFINNATCRNKTFASAKTLDAGYTTVDGDRLVIEVGYTNSTAGTTPQAAAKFGENATDLPVNETQTTDGAGWVEFSNTFTLAPSSYTSTDAYGMMGFFGM